MQLSQRRRLGEQAELLLIHRTAQAQDKDFRRSLKKMQDEAQ
jgi:hypothetical protein